MKIALITDTHLAAIATDIVANCVATIGWIDGLGADLAVHLGDITGDGVEDPDQFATAAEVLGRMRTPLRLVPGNHDIGDSPIPGRKSSEPPVQPDRLALYRGVFGADYWAQEIAGWTLVALNAQLLGLEDGEEAGQFDWLAGVLAGVSTPVGLLLHKPLFRTGPDDQEIHHRYVQHAPRRRLLELFAGHDLRFVASGHVHQLRHLTVGGAEHVWAPSSAYVFPDAIQERIGEKVVGAMLLSLTSNDHSFEFQIPPGVAQYDLADHAEMFPKLRNRLGKVADRGPA